MGNKKLTISLVTWNGEKYLPLLFDSLKKQSFQDFELIILDNGSTDKTCQYLNTDTEIINKQKNIGFASAHNEIFKKSNSDYFLVLNQDIYLAPEVLEKLVKFLDENKDVASVSPRLNKWDFKNKKFTDEVDSLGLKVLKSRRVVEIKTDSSVEVFGVSGACAMYSRKAVEEVGGLFDNNYFSYKEDVDLALRLRQRGLKSFVLPNVIAWHDRTGSELGNKDIDQAKNKKKQSKLIKYYSYRNHLITIYKNEYWQNFTIDFLFILWYELKKFIWFLLFDRQILKAWKDIWKMRKELKQKRREIIKMRKINWKEFRKTVRVV